MVGEEKACGDEGNPVTRNQKHVVPKKTAIIKSLVGTCFGSLGTHKTINAPPPSHLILSLLRNANDFLLHISFFCLPLSALSSSVPPFLIHMQVSSFLLSYSLAFPLCLSRHHLLLHYCLATSIFDSLDKVCHSSFVSIDRYFNQGISIERSCEQGMYVTIYNTDVVLFDVSP